MMKMRIVLCGNVLGYVKKVGLEGWKLVEREGIVGIEKERMVGKEKEILRVRGVGVGEEEGKEWFVGI